MFPPACAPRCLLTLLVRLDLYCFPRFSVLSGHEHEAYVPYTSIYAKELPPEDSAPAPVTSSLKDKANPPPQQAASADTDDPSASVRKGLLFDNGSSSGGAETFNAPPRGVNTDASMTAYSTCEPSSDAEPGSDADTLVSPTRISSGQTSVAGDEDVATEHKVGERDMERMIEQDAQKVAAESSAPFAVANLDEADQLGPNLEEDLPHRYEEAVAEAADASPDASEPHPHLVLQGTVTGIHPRHVVVAPQRGGATDHALTQLGHAPSKKLWSIDHVSIPYDYLVYALGSKMPDPLRSDARSKACGIDWMKKMQERITTADKIVIVGGGALGVEYALDIATIFPDKASKVTLLHSRKQLLPSFDVGIHDVVMNRLTQAGVNVILGERLALAQGCPLGSAVSSVDKSSGRTSVAPSPLDQPEGQQQIIRTTAGRELDADLLLLCTGQQPNSSLMAAFSPSSVDAGSRLVKVAPTLQVQADPSKAGAYGPFEFRPPCGDCDCFADRKAGTEHPHLSSFAPTAAATQQAPHEVLPNVYAIGDVADAFGAINAGYQAWTMAEVVARNIVRQIRQHESHAITAGGASPARAPLSLPATDTNTDTDINTNTNTDTNTNTNIKAQADATSPKTSEALASEETKEEVKAEDKAEALEHFTPIAPMLKLSLGMGSMVFQGLPGDDGKPLVEVRDDPEDLGVKSIWRFMAKASTADMHR